MARSKRNHDDFESNRTFAQVLLSPVVAVREWFADALGGDDSIRTRESGASSVFSILTLPFRFLFAIAVFMVQAWSTSRVGRAFVLGLPAVVTVFGCLSVLWVSTRYFNQITVGRTLGYYSFHANTPDAEPENVLMFAEKFVGLKPQDPKALFRLGLALENADDMPAALKVMNILAPPEAVAQPPQDTAEPADISLDEEEEKIGDFLPAHLWLSNHYQKQIFEDGFDSQDGLQSNTLAEKHLRRALKNDPENRDLAISMATLCELRAKRVKETDPAEYLAQLRKLESALSDAVKPPLLTILQVTQIPKLIQTKRELASLDETVNFEQSKKQFEKLFDELLKLGQKTPETIRMSIISQVVSGYVQLKEYDKAVAIITESLPSFDDVTLKQQLVNNAGFVFLQNAENNSDLDDKAQYSLRLSSICACLNSSVKERRAYEMLIGIIRHNQIHPEKFEWLQDTLLDTPKLALNHILIGCHLIHTGIENDDQDKMTKGTNHWKIAYKIDPQTQLMLSNILEIGLFFGTVPSETIDAMIQQAITMFPDKSLLHQSAGLSSMSKKDFEGAVASLEVAASTHRFPVIAHSLLKHCHELSGNSFKALNHGKRVEELLVDLAPKQQQQIQQHIDDLIKKTQK